MNLQLIIKTEYLTDIRSKSFWIATLVMPLIMVAFGGFIGYLGQDSTVLTETASPVSPDKDEMTGMQVFGMMLGMMLTLFIMIYGAQIFNKVKKEKTNRIVEVLATCVDGRTMMLAKIIAVALVGLTQLLLWGVLIAVLVAGIYIVFSPSIPLGFLANPKLYVGLIWSLAFFIGGYIFFGSLFAAIGAMSDRDNENQEYMTVLTFLLLASFYIGMFAVDNTSSSLAVWCSYIPFTSATVGAVNAISGEQPVWMSLLSLAVLYSFAALALAVSGKIYTSSLLLKGKRFTPKDILTFLRSK